MIKVYHLSTCSTCKKIINSIDFPANTIYKDIKTDVITKEEIEIMFQFSQSYEDLFSKRAMKYKSLGLKEKNLTEADYKQYILSEYTFLKRPVVITEKEIFIGNSAKNVEALKKTFNES